MLAEWFIGTVRVAARLKWASRGWSWRVQGATSHRSDGPECDLGGDDFLLIPRGGHVVSGPCDDPSMTPSTPLIFRWLGRGMASVARNGLASPARGLLAITFLISVCYSLSCSTQARTARQPQPGVPHIRVMTYNVNYGLDGDPDGIAAIAAADADLVLLQETTAGWEQALREALGERYPHMAFRHCCIAGGLGVLSKLPISEREYVHSEAGWFPAWRLIVQGPAGPLQVLNLHLRPQVSDSGSVVSGYFSTPPIRRAEAEQYYPLLDPELPTLIAGDLNESPGGRAIGYLQGKGFRNALPEFGGTQQTWRWQTSLGTIRAQLDHLLYRGPLEPLQVEVVAAGRSDHLPVIGTFELTPKTADRALPTSGTATSIPSSMAPTTTTSSAGS